MSQATLQEVAFDRLGVDAPRCFFLAASGRRRPNLADRPHLQNARHAENSTVTQCNEAEITRACAVARDAKNSMNGEMGGVAMGRMK